MELFKKMLEHFKEKINNQGRKRLIENCVIVIIIGVIAIIAGGSFFKNNDKKSETGIDTITDSQTTAKIIGSADEKEDLQKKLESILSKIGGAGNVNVMVTYISGKESVLAYDTKRSDNDTQEKDNGGGTRSIKNSDLENKIVYEESGNGVKKPITLKELQPAVKGVVVVADGAGDPVVKESITRAVQVLVDVPIHKIQVLPRNK